MALTADQERRLVNIIAWVRIAKETLPAINEGPVDPGRVAQMSALLDRLYGTSIALQGATAGAAASSAPVMVPSEAVRGHRAA